MEEEKNLFADILLLAKLQICQTVNSIVKENKKPLTSPTLGSIGISTGFRRCCLLSTLRDLDLRSRDLRLLLSRDLDRDRERDLRRSRERLLRLSRDLDRDRLPSRLRLRRRRRSRERLLL